MYLTLRTTVSIQETGPRSIVSFYNHHLQYVSKYMSNANKM